MRFNIKRVLTLALAALLVIGCLAGCDYHEETDDTNTIAMIVDGENYYMDEFKLYTYRAQYSLEDMYQFYVLYLYGGSYDKLWESDWAEALGYGTQQLYQTKTLVKYANENGIKLTDEETANAKAQVEKFKKDNPKLVEYAKANDALLEKYMLENALANKAYLDLIKDVDMNFDKEEFTRKNVEGITVIAKEEKPSEKKEDEEEKAEEGTTAKEDADADKAEEKADDTTAAEEKADDTTAAEEKADDTTAAEEKADDTTAAEDEHEHDGEPEEDEHEHYTEEEMEAARTKVMAEIEKRLQAGDKVEDIVEDYKEDVTVSVSAMAAISAAPTDAVKEGEDIEEYKQLAWSLKKGEVKTGVYDDSESGESEVGYCLRCVDDDDADLRKKAEDEELAKRKTELFKKNYEPLAAKTKEFHIFSEKVAANVKYQGKLHDSLTITGDDMEKLDELEATGVVEENGEDEKTEK